MSVFNLPKTRASRDSVPVIPALAEILDEYRSSMGSPKAGVVFHFGDGLPICVDRVGRRVIRRALVRGHPFAVVRLARTPAGTCLEPV